MNSVMDEKTIDLKWFGKWSFKQILGVIVAFAVALILTLYGFGASCSCFGILIIAVILYMLPRLMGVEHVKLMTLVGALFAVTAILIGGLFMAPGFVEGNQGSPPVDNNEFYDSVDYIYVGGGIEIEAVLSDDIGSRTVHFVYAEVRGIVFGGIPNATFDMETQLTAAGTMANGSVTLDPEKLYIGYVIIREVNASGDTVAVEGSETYWRFLTDAFEGSITSLTLYGCAYFMVQIMIIFFMIMIFSNIMKSRMVKTREKMEKEGRLYPQGYGRCDNCGSMVLPGEVKCRKCGAYIDRPDEMKPDKKDFFECSDCGAEVPMDAEECPKCGAKFDEEEYEVVHSDGTVETTKETMACPECGALSPAASTFCTRCGAKFDKKKK